MANSSTILVLESNSWCEHLIANSPRWANNEEMIRNGTMYGAFIAYILEFHSFGGVCSHFFLTTKEIVLGGNKWQSYHTFLKKTTYWTWPHKCKGFHHLQKPWHLSTSSFQASCHFINIFMVLIFLTI